MKSLQSMHHHQHQQQRLNSHSSRAVLEDHAGSAGESSQLDSLLQSIFDAQQQQQLRVKETVRNSTAVTQQQLSYPHSTPAPAMPPSSNAVPATGALSHSEAVMVHPSTRERHPHTHEPLAQHQHDSNSPSAAPTAVLTSSASSSSSTFASSSSSFALNSLVQCVYSFTPFSSRQLAFTGGEILTIRSRALKGWITAENDRGEKGHVPENYLKEKKEKKKGTLRGEAKRQAMAALAGPTLTETKLPLSTALPAIPSATATGAETSVVPSPMPSITVATSNSHSTPLKCLPSLSVSEKDTRDRSNAVNSTSESNGVTASSAASIASLRQVLRQQQQQQQPQSQPQTHCPHSLFSFIPTRTQWTRDQFATQLNEQISYMSKFSTPACDSILATLLSRIDTSTDMQESMKEIESQVDEYIKLQYDSGKHETQTREVAKDDPLSTTLAISDTLTSFLMYSTSYTSLLTREADFTAKIERRAAEDKRIAQIYREIEEERKRLDDGGGFTDEEEETSVNTRRETEEEKKGDDATDHVKSNPPLPSAPSGILSSTASATPAAPLSPSRHPSAPHSSPKSSTPNPQSSPSSSPTLRSIAGSTPRQIPARTLRGGAAGKTSLAANAAFGYLERLSHFEVKKDTDDDADLADTHEPHPTFLHDLTSPNPLLSPSPSSSPCSSPPLSPKAQQLQHVLQYRGITGHHMNTVRPRSRIAMTNTFRKGIVSPCTAIRQRNREEMIARMTMRRGSILRMTTSNSRHHGAAVVISPIVSGDTSPISATSASHSTMSDLGATSVMSANSRKSVRWAPDEELVSRHQQRSVEDAYAIDYDHEEEQTRALRVRQRKMEEEKEKEQKKARRKGSGAVLPGTLELTSKSTMRPLSSPSRPPDLVLPD